MSKEKIVEMFAFVVLDKDGTEGIPAVNIHGQLHPLVGADLDRVESLKELIRPMLKDMPSPVEIRKFTKMETIETLANE